MRAEVTRVRGRFAAAAIAVIAVGLLAAAAVAATTGAVVQETQFTVPAGTSTPFASPGQADAVAVCPGRQRATGGGVVQSGDPTGLFLHSSGPLNAGATTLDTDDGDIAKEWYASLENDSGIFSGSTGQSRTARVFALCTRDSDARIQANTFTVPNTGVGLELGESSVRCPGKQRALGGGVVNSGAREDISLVASGPLGPSGDISSTGDGDTAKRWYAAVDNASSHDALVKVFAICSLDSQATIQATKISAGANNLEEGFAKCGKGSRVLGGGIVQLGPPAVGLNVNASGPLDSSGVTLQTDDGDVATQWYASGQNTAFAQETWKVLAICE